MADPPDSLGPCSMLLVDFSCPSEALDVSCIRFVSGMPVAALAMCLDRVWTIFGRLTQLWQSIRFHDSVLDMPQATI